MALVVEAFCLRMRLLGFKHFCGNDYRGKRFSSARPESLLIKCDVGAYCCNFPGIEVVRLQRGN